MQRYRQKYSRCRHASIWYLEGMTPGEIRITKRKREERKGKERKGKTTAKCPPFSNALPTRKWLQSVDNVVRAPLDVQINWDRLMPTSSKRVPMDSSPERAHQDDYHFRSLPRLMSRSRLLGVSAWFRGVKSISSSPSPCIMR